uniref:Uncharacterized protein n=1 Tax=Panagrolaimus superbus TaxID=310955 RepID=A0A914Y8F4_9BILA
MNNQWLTPFGWNNTPSSSTNQQQFINSNGDQNHIHHLQQQQNQEQLQQQFQHQLHQQHPYPGRDHTLEPSAVFPSAVTNPYVGNYTTAAYGYPSYQNNPAAPQYSGMNSFEQAQIIQPTAFPVYWQANPCPNLQPPSIYGNFANSFAPIPFHLRRASSTTPVSTPPPRLRRQLRNTSYQKKAVPKTFMQAFLEAQRPNYQSSIPNAANYGQLFDTYDVPAPQPFETPGVCIIQKIENENFVPAYQEEPIEDDNDSEKIIDVEK